MTWFLLVTFALGQGVEEGYLDSKPVATRRQAVEQAQRLSAMPCEVSVVRSDKAEGEGGFVVRLEHTEGDCAVALRQIGGSGESGQPPRGLPDIPDTDGVPASIDKAREPRVGPGAGAGVEEALAKIARRHGGQAGYQPADRVVFRFVRTTPEGQRVEHVYARRGADRYLEVQILEGSGQSSRAGLAGGCPWFDGPTSHPLDRQATEEALQRFAPEQVLAFALSLAGERPDLPEVQSLRVERPAGDSALWLVFPGDRAEPPTRVEVTLPGWRVSAWVRGPTEGAITRSYADWKELAGGALYPTRVVTRDRERVLDTVEILEFDTSPALPDEWFPPCAE